MKHLLSFIHRLGLVLVLAGAFFPTWLWQIRLDDQRIAEPFNSLIVYWGDIAALGLVAWTLLMRLVKAQPIWRWGWRPITALIMSIALLSTLSLGWALHPGLALATALHWWLVVGVYLSVVNGGEDWRALAPWLALIVVVEAIVAVAQIRSGSTLVGRWLLHWVNELSAPNSQTSVVASVWGARLLRAYGTTAHPNHLAGYLAVSCLALAGATLVTPHRWARISFSLLLGINVLVLGLTFSRGGWLGFGVAFIYLFACALNIHRPRALFIGAIVFGVGLVFTLALWPWLVGRLQIAPVNIEQTAINDRAVLSDLAWEMIRQRPWGGVGSGNYMRGIAALTPAIGPDVPVHNMLILAIGELGLAGGLAVLLLYIQLGYQCWQGRANLVGVIGCALCLALLLANIFDVYLWGLPPSRLWLGVLLGVWANSSAPVVTRTPASTSGG